MPFLQFDVLPLASTPTTPQVDAVSSSEAASLHGHAALTPIIAGSVTGGLMGIAYIIGFSIYFYKRYKRKVRKAKVAAGLKEPKKVPEPAQKVVIPPDPAVLLGQRQPGENAFPDREHEPGLHFHLIHAHTSPSIKENGHHHHHHPLLTHSHTASSDKGGINITDEMVVPNGV